jgi:hypothetical protein
MDQKSDQLKEYVNEFLIRNPLSVTLTCRQRVNGEQLDEISLSRNITHFLNRLNYQIYRKKFSRFGEKLGVISVIEGDDRVRLHCHLTLEKPHHISHLKMCSLINQCWTKTKFGYLNFKVNSVIDEGWKSYQLKHRTKRDGLYSSVDWINTNSSV